MKKIIDVLMSRGVEPEVDKYVFLLQITLIVHWVASYTITFFARYLFLFLKFMASVIPTIEYDYTMDFDLGSSST